MKQLCLAALGLVLLADAHATSMDTLTLTNPQPLSGLGTPVDGTVRYCTDCLIGSTPCTSAGGSGAVAKREAGEWTCSGVPDGSLSPEKLGPQESGSFLANPGAIEGSPEEVSVEEAKQLLRGAPNQPFTLICAGQSNAKGADNSGDKTVQGGVKIWNGSAMVAAAFGTTPLNTAEEGTSTSNPALAVNNSCVHFSNNLRLSGLIQSAREIWIIPNWFSGNAIGNWTDSGAASTNFVALTDALDDAGVTQIDHVIWAQGEADSTTCSAPPCYNTLAGYRAQFDELYAQWQALPAWTEKTTVTVSQLNQFANSSESARNDAINTLTISPPSSLLSVVRTAGIQQSNFGLANTPHYDGLGQIQLGLRHFAAFAAMGAGITTGSSQAAPVASDGYATDAGKYIDCADNVATYQDGTTQSSTPIYLGADDLRAGATLGSVNCTFALPVQNSTPGLQYNMTILNVRSLTGGNTILTNAQGITYDTDAGTGSTTSLSLGLVAKYLIFTDRMRWSVLQISPISSTLPPNIVVTGTAVIGNSATFDVGGLTPVFGVTSQGVIGRKTNDNTGARLYLYKTRATSFTSNTILQDGDTVADMLFYGDDGTSTDKIVGRFRSQVSGTPSAGIVPGRLLFTVTNAAGSQIDAVDIASTGVMSTQFGFTTVGAFSANNNSNNTVRLCTGTCNALTSIGGGSGTVLVNSSAWDIDAAGAATGFTTINASGLITAGGGLSANSQKVISVADGASISDAVNLGQLTAAVEGRRKKDPVEWTTTGNITLSGLGTQANGEWTGSLVGSDRILAKNQTASEDNGIYTPDSGSWARTLDADTGAEVTNASTLVLFGVSVGDTYTQTETVTTIGTDPQEWVQTGDGATYAADESTLTLTATVFSEKDGGTTNAKLANMSEDLVKCRKEGAGTGAPQDCDAAETKDLLDISTSDVSGLSTVASTGSASDLASGVVPAARGGAGGVSGILKADGAGNVSAAASGTDYAPATSGSAVLLGDGSGGFSNYDGTSCSGQFPRSLSTAGVATCSRVANADIADTGDLTMLGNVSGSTGFVASLSRTQVQTNFVNPDGSTVEYSSNALRVKDAGVTNAKLANPATTVNGQTCTLGSSCTTANATTSTAGLESAADKTKLDSLPLAVGLTLSGGSAEADGSCRGNVTSGTADTFLCGARITVANGALGRMYRITALLQSSGTGTFTARLRAGTAGTIAGDTLLATTVASAAGVTNSWVFMQGFAYIAATGAVLTVGGTLRGSTSNATTTANFSPAAAAEALANINWASADWFIDFTGSSSSSTYTVRSLRVEAVP